MHTIKKQLSKALVVMLKVPAAGQVKTRLAPPLRKEDAAKLYRCFIDDTFRQIRRLKGDVDIIAAYTPQNMRAKARRIVPRGISIVPQKGDGLGARLHNLFLHLFELGYKQVAVIGSDSPDIPIEYIKKSFSLLKGKTELVLGPSRDGGYYLIAMARFCEEIFEEIPWSTSTVFKKTVKKAKDAGLGLAFLPQWYDIDDINSLLVLKKNIKEPSNAPKTHAFLENIFKKPIRSN